MMRVKVCGVTSAGDAELAAEAGASAVGLVFWAESPRAVAPAQARAIVRALPPFVSAVGVFVNATPAEAIAVADVVGLDMLQLHGDEAVDDWDGCARPLVKALAPDRFAGSPWRERARAVLLDAYDPVRRGGTGTLVDWGAAARCAAQAPVILAGGLTEHNVAEAIATVAPAALDVSSGVERAPGRKDAARLARFFAAVRDASPLAEDVSFLEKDRS